MGMLVWVTMGIAVWHFSVFVPDRFAGGIVGAFIGAVIGAAAFGVLVSGLDVPGRDATDIGTALLGVPGSMIGMAVVYWMGARNEDEELEQDLKRLAGELPG
jgi:membrane protein DedA with SNARE-associated domain